MDAGIPKRAPAVDALLVVARVPAGVFDLGGAVAIGASVLRLIGTLGVGVVAA
jgi:hypothetical protein